MEILGFTKEELQKVEDLLAASNVISSIYDNLYHLEIEGKQDSEEYQKLLKMLQEAINIENKKIEKISSNFEECKKIFKLLLSSNKLPKTSNTECILYQKYEDKVVRRVMSYLSEAIMLNVKFQQELLADIFNITNTPITHLHQSLNNSSKVQNAIIKDMLSIFLTILTEYISNKKYNKYKNELIMLKYYIAFIGKDIEIRMLNSQFNPSDLTYISSNMTANLLGLDEQQYNLAKEIESNFSATEHIIELLEIKDSDYESKRKNIESIVRQCYIRALLTLLSEDSVYDLNQKFHDLVDSDEYIKRHPNDRISENIIIQCFKSQKYDRAKTRNISFRFPI